MSGMFSEGQGKLAHKSVEWYTPKWIFDGLGLTFDMDPASPFDMETDVPATTKLTIFDDGLKNAWVGRVWLNPPYGATTGEWIRRMIHHNNGIALVFSRTDASWCQDAMRAASAMLFVKSRIQFVPGRENQHKRARCGAGTVMFAFGDECTAALQRLESHGVYVQNRLDTAQGSPDRRAKVLPTARHLEHHEAQLCIV